MSETHAPHRPPSQPDVLDVRRVRPDEWRALRGLRLAALRDAPLAFWRSLAEEEPLPDAHWQRWAEEGARGEGGLVLVAERDGRMVAMAAIDLDEGELCLGAMWVAPEARGLGLGQRLLEEGIAWARQRGLPELRLWVNADNAGALALYESSGFRANGRTEPQRARPELRVLQMTCDLSG